MDKFDRYKKYSYQLLIHPVFIVVTIFIVSLVSHNKFFFKITSENWSGPFLWYWFFAIFMYIIIFGTIFKKFKIDQE